ncbi:MAG TPA: hypothetical protein VHP81_03985 [Lachnospiraceae bacterium]|nr:hypothetical protein [Lachnospiraceae bacterium]
MIKNVLVIGVSLSLMFTDSVYPVKRTTVSNPIASEEAKNVSSERVGNMSVSKIKEILQKVKEIDDTDNGNLWGIPLHTRVMVVDADTYKVVATEANNKGNFKKMGSLYVGQLPDDTALANTSIHYGGKTWAMVLYSDEDDELDTLALYVHEMFHNVQEELGQNGDFYDNSHMDEMNARIYLKLEWQALHKALVSSGEEKHTAIADALTFRLARRKEYHSTKNENLFEIQEGMAEYTCQKLVYTTDDIMSQILQKDWDRYLDEAKTETLVRSFAYHSGVLYGLLLDDYSTNWRESITSSSDLGEMLRQCCSIHLSDLSLEESTKRFDYTSIYDYELKRKHKLEKITSKYIETFVNGPTLQLKLNKAQVSFNPSKVWQLKGHGTVYTTAEIYDSFGKIVVESGGLLLSSNWDSAFVSSKRIKINGSTITGNGWTLKLKKGYILNRKKNGCYVIIKR